MDNNRWILRTVASQFTRSLIYKLLYFCEYCIAITIIRIQKPWKTCRVVEEAWPTTI